LSLLIILASILMPVFLFLHQLEYFSGGTGGACNTGNCQVYFSFHILPETFQIITDIVRMIFQRHFRKIPQPITTAGISNEQFAVGHTAGLGESTEQVFPFQRWYFTAAVHIPSNDGGSPATFWIVRIIHFNDRIYQPVPHYIGNRTARQLYGVVGRIKTMCPFFHIPAVISSFPHHIYFFVQ